MIRIGQGPHQKTLLLVGGGRLARHWRFYFKQLGWSFLTWERSEGEARWRELLPSCHIVALAISDGAIGAFRDAHLRDFQGKIVHFSGALNLPGTIALHPLMSFGPDLYPADFYPRIHFSVTGADNLRDVLPLPNPFTVLPAGDKALYHALCVLGGNFPVLLWNQMETELRRLGLPEDGIRLYIARVAENYLARGSAALTGPLVRKDEGTIRKNLEALQNDPWRNVYLAMKEATT
ncbi:MAG: DUF2520 domain-containing protein [Bdellovibrionaceae bacterium]|nr:DUF2520 domain-containing protein [Pseudobdellovibrionaceae bacterium]